jgi:hypothetical protein
MLRLLPGPKLLFHASLAALAIEITKIKSLCCQTLKIIFNVENVNLLGCKWNETVSNRIHNVSDEMC